MDMIFVCIYADTTGLFTNDQCDEDNMCNVAFPVEILRKWYEVHTEIAWETAADLKKPINEVTFEDWLNHTIWADDTDGLWQFSIDNGYMPKYVERC